MSRFERTPGAESSLPARLRAGAGTQLERRVLDAAANEEPSRELCERMALAIGVAPPPLAPIPPDVPDLGAPAPDFFAGSRALLTWLSAAGAVVAVVAAVVTMRSGEHASAPVRSAPAPVYSASASLPVRAPSSSLASPPAQVAEAPALQAPSVAALAAPSSRGRSTVPAADIQEQIALVDAARAAVAAGASSRALRLVRQYQSKYPGGSFRPEAAVLKIEALSKLGRTAEARALAEGFTAEYGGGPLADRVSRLGGRARP